MPSRSRKFVALAAAAVALLAAGCGGTGLDLGSDEGVDVPPGGYEEAGTAICDQVAGRFAEAQATEPRTFDQGDEVVRTLLAVAVEGQRQLETLDPPADQRDAFTRYMRARDEVVALLEEARDAAGAEDGAAYERARRAALDGVGKRADLAREAGLPDCAKSERG